MLWQEVAYVAVGFLCSNHRTSVARQPLGVLAVVVVVFAFLLVLSAASIYGCCGGIGGGCYMGRVASAKHSRHVGTKEPYWRHCARERGACSFLMARNGNPLWC